MKQLICSGRLARTGCESLARGLGLLLALVAVSGCNTLDPTGEWRGLDRAPATAGTMIAAAPAPATSSASAAAAATAPTATVAVSASAVANVTPTAAPEAVAAAAMTATVAASSAVRPSQSSSPSLAAKRPDPRSLELLLGEAETHYRARRLQEAEQSFRAVVDREPRSLHAWLRLGNLRHGRGDLEAAARAYRQASAHPPTHALDQEAREKALANLAILALEQARLALEDLGGEGQSAAARDRARTLSSLVEQRQSALDTEIRRIAPAAVPALAVDRLGMAMSEAAVPRREANDRPGGVSAASFAAQPIGGGRVRVESFLPDSTSSR